MAFFNFNGSRAAALSLLFYTAMGALVNVPNFGANPTNIQMNIYVPSNLAAKPALILALHPCGGNGPAYAQMANYNTAADQYGFITIYPSTTHDNNCWDVASAKSLTHEGGGDTQSLANMVKYAISTYDVDTLRIFVTGSSSGAMMTNVMGVVYPDLFAAGSGYSGVAAGCLAGSPGASPSTADPACANGQHIKTQAQWIAQAKAMYPSWTGPYPRMQVWHGTSDNLVLYPNLGEQVKQWSGLLDVPFKRNLTNTPQSAYTEMIYGDGTKFVAYSASGVGHTVPVHVTVDLAWFGIPSGAPIPTSTYVTSSTTVISRTTTIVTTTTPTAVGTVPRYGQCGGQQWKGSTVCASPYTCTYSNAYYSQCL
ncbi:feruloyl esterase b precursor [Phlyctema vagabunda]|uniref:Carboxylic ester hydrolase n=1 Tax=Phlyctema vagabunda TaxID=108571 RepID=A0ABR4P612_9HELO